MFAALPALKFWISATHAVFGERCRLHCDKGLELLPPFQRQPSTSPCFAVPSGWLLGFAVPRRLQPQGEPRFCVGASQKKRQPQHTCSVWRPFQPTPKKTKSNSRKNTPISVANLLSQFHRFDRPMTGRPMGPFCAAAKSTESEP